MARAGSRVYVPHEMEFFPGFAWPVPRAFASAVSVCRFEEGDVLYEREAAYGAATSRTAVGAHVQVLDPPRSARSAPADAEGSRFLANWDSPVSVELCIHTTDATQADGSAGATEVLASTQGRLFTCLWRGDRSLLKQHEPGGESPPLPLRARDLQQHLEGAVAGLRDAARKSVNSGKGLLFVMVLDQASEASLAKARLVESRLLSRFSCHAADLSPEEAGVPAGREFHPALSLRGIAIESADEETVRSVLKSGLYAPSRARAEPEEAASDRFKLDRHGLLVPLAE